MNTKLSSRSAKKIFSVILLLSLTFSNLGGNRISLVFAQNIKTGALEPVVDPLLSDYNDTVFGFSFLYSGSLTYNPWYPTFDILASSSFYYSKLVDLPGTPEIAVTVFDNSNQIPLDNWVLLHSISDLNNIPLVLQNSAAIFENTGNLNKIRINGFDAILFSQISEGFTKGRLIVDNDKTIISVSYIDFGDGGLKDSFATIAASLRKDNDVASLSIDQNAQSEIVNIIKTYPSPVIAIVNSVQDQGELAAASTGYKLPWINGISHTVIQGWGGSYSHNNTQEWYAYDFNLSEGEAVRAARGGTVAWATGQYTACGGSEYANLGNRVTINHDDGTATLYLHLKNVNVSQNQSVPQGMKVGEAGKTGYTSCNPHLHFQRQAQGIWITNSQAVYFDEYPAQQLQSNGTPYISQNGSVGNPPLLTLTLGSTLQSRPVTIELRTLGPLVQSVFTQSTLSEANGNITDYSLTNVHPGTYTLLVKPQGWLRKEKQVTLVSGPNFVDLGPAFTFQACLNLTGSCPGDIDLINGSDVRGNNKIDIVDIGILIDKYGQNYPLADLNQDGIVNIVDIGMLIDSYGRTGEGGPIFASSVTLLSTTDGASQSTLDGAQLSLTDSAPGSPAQVGNIVTLNLDYDTAALSMAGISAVIDYDECVLQPLTDQITSGGIFPSTGIVSTPGTLEYHTYKSVGELPVSGTGRVASIPFRVIASVPSSTTIALSLKPGSSYYSAMDQADIHQPFLDSVNNVALYPTGNPPRPAQSAQITSPLSGETINQNFVLLQAQASDACNGLHQVTFYVFYDGQWHAVGTDTDGTDGWLVYWDASQVADQVIKVKAFAGDFAGNGVETPISNNVILDRKTNILFNGGFEVGDSNPLGWQTDAWAPSSSTFLWDSTKKHSGDRSVEIANSYNNDARWIQTVYVQPNSDYILSGWIKTLIVQHSSDSNDVGANLSIMGGFEHTVGLIGTNDWTYVSLPFNSGSRTQVDIAARLGMYSGTTTGIAWFDDLKLEPISTLMCYTLTKSVIPAGSGNITADPTPNCNNGTQYIHGTVVKLTAFPDTNYNFSSWSGDASGALNPTYATMTSNKSVTANFISTVNLSGNVGVGGVTLSYVDGTVNTITSDGGGNYSMALPTGWTGTVTPYKTGYTFTPINRVYNNLQSNQTGQDFTAQVCANCADMNATMAGNLLGSFTLASGQAVTPYYNGVTGGPVKIQSTNGVTILTSEHRNYQTSFSETLGYPDNQLTTEYWFTRYAYNANVKTWILVANPTNQIAEVSVYIGDLVNPIESFNMAAGASVPKFYNGVAGGPVLVQSTNGVDILASEHRNYQTSFSETLGYPDDQLTTKYWFTRYAYNSNVKTWLLVTNPTDSEAEIDLYIGDLVNPIESFTLGAGASVSKFYNGVVGGPVVVESTNGVGILASEHRNYQTSFSETLGYPDNQLTTEYWFTRYAYNANVKTWILIANPTNQTAEVDVYLGSDSDPIASYSIPAGATVTPFYNGVANGPVRVVSTNGVNILASEHRNYQTSFSETLGYPNDQLTTMYWFTRYAYNANVKTWILIANP